MVSLAIDISSRDFDFPNTKFGASLFLHSSHFKADRQWAAVNGDEVDIENVGTSLSGYYSYLIPALYYKHQKGEAEWKLGVGLGIGSARFSGDALFGPDLEVSRTQPKTSLSASANDVLAYMVFGDLKLPKWRVRLSIGGFRFSDSDYRYEFLEGTLTFSYIFSIL